MSFGSAEGGGFNDVSRAYKEKPTLENYLTLRRANPTAEIEVAVLVASATFSPWRRSLSDTALRRIRL